MRLSQKPKQCHLLYPSMLKMLLNTYVNGHLCALRKKLTLTQHNYLRVPFFEKSNVHRTRLWHHFNVRSIFKACRLVDVLRKEKESCNKKSLTSLMKVNNNKKVTTLGANRMVLYLIRVVIMNINLSRRRFSSKRNFLLMDFFQL